MKYSGKHWVHEVGPLQLTEEWLTVVRREGVPISPYTMENLRQYRDSVVEAIVKRAEGKTCRPTLHHRLVGFFEQGRRLDLYLDVTDYMLFLAVNKEAEKDPEYASFLKEGGRGFVLYSHILGNCAVVRSGDGKFLVGKRALTLHDYPGGFDTPGGHSEVDKHGFTGKGLFDAIRMEMEEEVGIKATDIASLHATGITRDTRNYKPVLTFTAQLGISEHELRGRLTDKEYERFEFLTEEGMKDAVESDHLLPGSQGAAVAFFHFEGKKIPHIRAEA